MKMNRLKEKINYLFLKCTKTDEIYSLFIFEQESEHAIKGKKKENDDTQRE